MQKGFFTFYSMKKITILLLSLILVLACKTKNNEQKYTLLNCYGVYKTDSLLVEIVSYIDKLPENVKEENRFDSSNRQHYIEGFKTRFQFVNYYISNDSTHYFAVFAKTASLYNKKRLVAGKFKITNNLIIDFEEVYITNKLEEQKLTQIKDSLFTQLLQNIEIKHPEIEWPNKAVYYSKSKHNWISK